MRKILFVFAILYCTTAMAQNKSVAVTEVVDKEDKVSYAIEIMVRTRLTAAISMKQGYTAYDRVDLQSIMQEHDFQRTGLVDDATIKKLGEMTGASLILIPEVAMGDDGKIYVAVKMLDVVTAKTLMSTGELMGNSSAEVEEGCRVLTEKILGIKSNSANTSAVPDKPITLFGYLHVFPTDIGEFQTLPSQLLSAINNKATYGYDSWRLPTTEELSIMRANSHMIPGFKNAEYLCSDSSTKGLARLVTTDMTAAEKIKAEEQEKEKDKQIRKEAIFNLLGIHANLEQYMIFDNKVVCCSSGQYEFLNGELMQPSHPNPKFKIHYDSELTRAYLEYIKTTEATNYNDILYYGICYQVGEPWKFWTKRNEYDVRVTIFKISSDGSGMSELRQHVWRNRKGESTYGRSYSNYWGYEKISHLFVAELPSEQLIVQEMNNIKKTKYSN